MAKNNNSHNSFFDNNNNLKNTQNQAKNAKNNSKNGQSSPKIAKNRQKKLKPEILSLIDKTLFRLVLGGPRKPQRPPFFENNFNHFDNNFTATESAQTVLGDETDLFVTSPGASLCLGMVYFASSDQRVARRLAVPKNPLFLADSRPELLFYRVFSFNLILWNEIQPTEAWLKRSIPSVLWEIWGVKRKIWANKSKNIGGKAGNKAENSENSERTANSKKHNFQIFAFTVLGCFSALALKLAGSLNGTAKAMALEYLKRVGRFKRLLPESCYKAFRVSIAVGLAVVMAGSGDLEVFRVLRGLRRIENNVFCF